MTLSLRVHRSDLGSGGIPLPGARADPDAGDREVRQDLTLSGPGGARIYDVRITPIRAHGERLTGHVVLLRDVTERRHTEVALRDRERRNRELVENARPHLHV